MHNAILAGPEFAIVLLHVFVWGTLAVRWSGFAPRDRWTWWAVVPAVGFAGLGAELFMLGEVRVLTRGAMYASTAVMLAGCVWGRPLAGWPRRAAASRPRREAALAAVVAAAGALVLAGCFKAPAREDELGYHWPAPLLWAGAHGWVASPYRLTNGTALAEMLFTVAALFGNPTVAHLTSAAFLVVIVAACGALARRSAGRPGRRRRRRCRCRC